MGGAFFLWLMSALRSCSFFWNSARSGLLLCPTQRVDAVGVGDPTGALGPFVGTRVTALGAGANGVGPAPSRWVASAHLQPLARQLVETVDRFHRDHPRQPGAPRATVLAAVPGRTAPDVAAHALERTLSDGSLRVADDRGALARPG